jgi:SHS2 domain-containing protein
MGLFAMVVEESPRGREASSREFSVRGRRHDYLLFDWLNELLFVFDTERLLLGRFDVHVTEAGLVATASAWPWDEQLDRPLHEVKAITYHGLRVEPTPEGWLAEVIVDI